MAVEYLVSLDEDYKLLGITDDSYDRLYKKLKVIPNALKFSTLNLKEILRKR